MTREPTSPCGECSMCCKLLPVPDLPWGAKPANTWCQHCNIGKGCGIHEERPDVCRGFHCFWSYGLLPDDCRPDQSHAIPYVSPVEGQKRIMVVVDPQRPDAWQKGSLHRWINGMVDRGFEVVILVGDERKLLQRKLA